MSVRSKGHKRYHMQRLTNDILVLDLDDLVLDNLSDVDLVNQKVSLVGAPGLCPRELHSSGPSEVTTCHLSDSQIHFLKISLKDYPELIKEMNI